MRQLPLAIRLRDFALFETFEPGPNGAAIAALREHSGSGPALWLWGPASSGKSHLLQAACAAQPGGAYLPVRELLLAGPEVLDGWDDRMLVCIDDIDLLAGKPDWERAAFRLFNSLWEAGGRLVASARAGPAVVRFALPDLHSRLAWGGVFRLESLADDDRVAALKRRAAYRGLELPEDAARYLLRRLPRDMRALCDWLDRLDAASLAAARRLTLPFVRSVIEEARQESSASPS